MKKASPKRKYGGEKPRRIDYFFVHWHAHKFYWPSFPPTKEAAISSCFISKKEKNSTRQMLLLSMTDLSFCGEFASCFLSWAFLSYNVPCVMDVLGVFFCEARFFPFFRVN